MSKLLITSLIILMVSSIIELIFFPMSMVWDITDTTQLALRGIEALSGFATTFALYND